MYVLVVSIVVFFLSVTIPVLLERDWDGEKLKRQRAKLTDEERDSYRIETSPLTGDTYSDSDMYWCAWHVYQPKIKDHLSSGSTCSVISYAESESRAFDEAEKWIAKQAKLASPDKYPANTRKVTGSDLVQKQKEKEAQDFSDDIGE